MSTCKVSRQIFFILNLLHLYLDNAYCDDANRNSSPNYEYTQIFQSMPALFEYLLGAVEERPEILEKNDVNIFKGYGDGENSERKPEEYHKIPKEDGEETNIEHKELKRDADFFNYNDKESKNNVFLDNRTVETNDFKEFSDTKAYQTIDNINGDLAWNNEKGYAGYQTLFRLDVKPEEIEKNIILAEKLLEDFNNKNNKK